MSAVSPACSISDARKLVSDLFTPNPWIYWLDMLITLGVAYSAAAIYLAETPFTPLKIVCYIIAGIGLFRASLFMHEVVHFRRGEMVAFKATWNILAGVPMLPVGLRFHALHHLFPSLPYHNLGIAHRRLMAALPDGSAYHQVNYPSFWAALRELMRNSRRAMSDPPPGSDLWYARRREELAPVAAVLDQEAAADAEPAAMPGDRAGRPSLVKLFVKRERDAA